MKKIYISLCLVLSGTWLSAQVQNYAIGDVIPDFTVTDLNGVEHSLYEYTAQGKYVLVDFFAHWCGPCANWAPTINEFYHKYGCNEGSVVVIAVELEGTNDQTHAFEEWAGIDDQNPFPAASGLDGGGAAVHAAYNIAAFPTYISVNPENVMMDNDIWPLTGVETLEAAFPDGALVEMACTVGVQEASNAGSSFTMAPNPARDMTQLLLANMTSGMLTTSVVDATGRMVLTRRDYVQAGAGMLTLDVAALQSGIYLVTAVHDGKAIGTSRLVIE